MQNAKDLKDFLIGSNDLIGEDELGQEYKIKTTINTIFR